MYAGASRPDRDGLTNREEYEHHTHPLKSDTDGDGMPDDWEIGRDLDPNDAADGNHVAPNGYTWVEVYISGLIDRP